MTGNSAINNHPKPKLLNQQPAQRKNLQKSSSSGSSGSTSSTRSSPSHKSTVSDNSLTQSNSSTSSKKSSLSKSTTTSSAKSTLAKGSAILGSKSTSNKSNTTPTTPSTASTLGGNNTNSNFKTFDWTSPSSSQDTKTQSKSSATSNGIIQYASGLEMMDPSIFTEPSTTANGQISGGSDSGLINPVGKLQSMGIFNSVNAWLGAKFFGASDKMANEIASGGQSPPSNMVSLPSRFSNLSTHAYAPSAITTISQSPRQVTSNIPSNSSKSVQILATTPPADKTPSLTTETQPILGKHPNSQDPGQTSSGPASPPTPGLTLQGESRGAVTTSEATSPQGKTISDNTKNRATSSSSSRTPSTQSNSDKSKLPFPNVPADPPANGNSDQVRDWAKYSFSNLKAETAWGPGNGKEKAAYFEQQLKQITMKANAKYQGLFMWKKAKGMDGSTLFISGQISATPHAFIIKPDGTVYQTTLDSGHIDMGTNKRGTTTYTPNYNTMPPYTLRFQR